MGHRSSEQWATKIEGKLYVNFEEILKTSLDMDTMPLTRHGLRSPNQQLQNQDSSLGTKFSNVLWQDTWKNLECEWYENSTGTKLASVGWIIYGLQSLALPLVSPLCLSRPGGVHCLLTDSYFTCNYKFSSSVWRLNSCWRGRRGGVFKKDFYEH